MSTVYHHVQKVNAQYECLDKYIIQLTEYIFSKTIEWWLSYINALTWCSLRLSNRLGSTKLSSSPLWTEKRSEICWQNRRGISLQKSLKFNSSKILNWRTLSLNYNVTIKRFNWDESWHIAAPVFLLHTSSLFPQWNISWIPWHFWSVFLSCLRICIAPERAKNVEDTNRSDSLLQIMGIGIGPQFFHT